MHSFTSIVSIFGKKTSSGTSWIIDKWFPVWLWMIQTQQSFIAMKGTAVCKTTRIYVVVVVDDDDNGDDDDARPTFFQKRKVLYPSMLYSDDTAF